MTIYAICFTPGGEKTLGRILDGFAREADSVPVCVRVNALGSYRKTPEKCFAPEEDFAPDRRISEWHGGLSAWMADAIQDADAFVFVGAAGIAIRAMAPYIADKTKDPALIVVDEKGQFVIPLLSGHIGGANELARQIAPVLGAQAVLTTATDVRGLFAVDVFAKKNNLQISDMRLAKEVSAALLRGERIGFYSDLPAEGVCPAELEFMTEAETGVRPAHAADTAAGTEERAAAAGTGIVVSAYQRSVFPRQLSLTPRCLTVGIGCKKDTAKEKILTAVAAVFCGAGLSLQAIAGIASVDLKKEEPGLLAAASEYGVPFAVFPAAALAEAEGVFSESAFVKHVTGVDNVCERAAVLASGGELIVRKTAADGVAVAVAMGRVKILF